jgi:RHS repeat-associated protein
MAWLRAFSELTSGMRRAGRRIRRSVPRWVSVLLAPVLAAGMSPVVPVSVVAASAVAVTAASVATAGPARAASGSVLILSTSVNGGSSSAEAKAAANLGFTVTVATPSTWDAMTTAQFKAYSALIIGDPSSGSTCASTVPSDALSTAGTWGPAVTGNVALLGTAPVLAGSAGSALIADGVGYAVTPPAGSSGTTGLYVSLNCEYATAAAGTAVPLLASVDGGGFTVTGQSASCPDSGTVNTWEADNAAAFNGLSSSALAAWPAPACSVQETVTAWPAGFTAVAYGATSGSFASPADFTASDGATGQPYVLLGTPVSAGTAELAPSTGGEVPTGTLIGGANPVAPGAEQASVGDPVDSENGDFTLPTTDMSIPTFGPTLDFSRSYDALVAQQETQSGSPGPMGYGWTDNWASSLSTAEPVPGDVYTLAGLATDDGEGGPPGQAVLDYPTTVYFNGSDAYIADSAGNRVEEIPGTSKTQWGQVMTAGDVYTIAGSDTGVAGDSGNGTAADRSLLNSPSGVSMDDAGDLFIDDSSNNRIVEIAASSSPWGNMSNPVAGDLYTVAGVAGVAGVGGDGKAATSSDLNDPEMAFIGGNAGGNLYIADAGNNRIQMVSQISQTKWGQSMSPYDVYTIAGSAAGTSGDSGDGTNAHTSALLNGPEDMSVSSAGDMYIADTLNNRIQEVPKATGTQWGNTTSFTADDMYTVAGSASGTTGTSGDGGKATSALLNFPVAVLSANGEQLYIADSGNNRIQEAAWTTHTEFGQSMTANDIYTIAGSRAGTQGDSGNGGAATSALLNSPSGVTLGASSNLYIADSGNNVVREVSASTADISGYAGNGETLGDTGDGGPAVTAGLTNPVGVATDARGNVYIADTNNNRVQEIAATSHTQFGIAMTAGDVYTIAGSASGVAGDSGDGGPATSALLNSPMAVAVDAAGDLYFAEYGNNRVQEVAAASGTQRGVAMTAGDIYTVAGNAAGNSGDSGDGGAATSALLNLPIGIAVDAAGDIYIADENNNRVQEVAGVTGTQWGRSMTANDIYTIAGSSTGAFGDTGDGGLATSALLTGPSGVALDGAGNLYISDDGNNRIQEVAVATGPQRGVTKMTADDIYTIAGSSTGAFGDTGDGGRATSALLNDPFAVEVDSSGNLYVTDSNNNRIQEVAFADGTQWGTSMTANDVYTIAGSVSGAFGTTGDGGPATSALLDDPLGVAVDPSGDVFLTDNANNRIREVTATATTTITPAPGQTSWLSPAPGGITVAQPGGAEVTFYAQTSGTCSAPYVTAGGYCALPQDVNASLTYSSATSTYTFSPAPGSTFTYAQNGVMTGKTDSAGDTETITYGTPSPGSGNCPATAYACDTISSASGRSLVTGQNSAGLVTSATDPMGREWTYSYTGSDLTKATDPMGNVTSYTYGEGSTGNPLQANDLLTVTGPNAQPGGPDAGDATVNVYNAAGQVTSQTDPMGAVTTFNYCVNAAAGNCMNESTGTGDVTVTDADGNATVYNYSQAVLTATTIWNGTTPAESDFGPDTTATGSMAGTLLAAWTTNADGERTSYSYDSDGHLTSLTDPLGHAGTMWSTSLGGASCGADATAASPCSANQTGPAAAPAGQVITPPSAAPPQGVSYSLYDNDGNELYSTTGVYAPGSNTASYTQTGYTLYKGNSVTIGGNNISCNASPPSQSLPCAEIDASGVVTQLAYNAAGDLTSSSTPDGNGSEVATTTYGYNGDGQVTSVVSPDGNLPGANSGNYTTITAYNADGGTSSVTAAGGSGATVTPRTSYFGYDADGNQTTVEDARGYTTTTTFNADDEPTMVTDPTGNSALTCYDGAGEISQTVPAAGVAANSLTQGSCPSSYPSGYGKRLASDATTYTFDATGQDTSTTTPAPAGQSGYETTSFSYDPAGLPIQITSPPTSNASGAPDQVTENTYDIDGQLTSQTIGDGTSASSTTSYCYDPNGDVTAIVAPDGNVSGTAPCETSSPWVVSSSSYPTQASFQSTNSYDSAGQLVSTTSPVTAAAPSGATTSYTYDTAGDLSTSTDPNGVIATMTYNSADLETGVSYSGSSAHAVTYSYDAEGNLTGMTDATGSSSYVYDPFGELTSAENGASQTVGYTYDADGDATGVTYPLPSSATWASTDTVGYGYNHSDVLTSVTDFNGHQIGITPNADGLPSSATLGSTGDTISYTYDQTDAPSEIALGNGSTTLQSFTYSDAPSSDILSETDVPSSSKSPAAYTYDAQGRVTSMTPGSGSPLSYGFDASGNLTTSPTGAAAAYDDDDELVATLLAGTTTSYAYNADGQRLTAKQGSATIAAGTWNGAAELTSYSDPAADMTAATYDGNGARASATTGSGTQNFVWGNGSELLMDSSNAYIYAGGTTPAEQVSLSAGTVSYLDADTLGSVRGIVSSTGALTATTSYDAWGNPETAGGLTSYTPFGYAGGFTDPTGLIYLINRYYDPATGQFLSIDPAVGQTGEPYSYAGGDPVSASDPEGLWQVGIPSQQNPDSSELQFQSWVGTILGVPEGVADAQFRVQFNSPLPKPNDKNRIIDIYQSGFGWLNELKVGYQSNSAFNASEYTRDRYLTKNNTKAYGVPTSIACHPAPASRSCTSFSANGDTWWFRYKYPSRSTCQLYWVPLTRCPNSKLRGELFSRKMNLVYVVWYEDEPDPQPIYRRHRDAIEKALESNSCPIDALDNTGLPIIKFESSPGKCDDSL